MKTLIKKFAMPVLSIAIISSFSTMSMAAPIHKASHLKTPKYIFLFIGDGMSYPQITAANDYVSKMNNKANDSLNFMRFPYSGTATTYDLNSFIPDSAAAGTAIATGNKTYSGVISMGKEKKIPYESIASKIKKQLKYKVGIISSVSLDHATPAVFYANQASRHNYYDIELQLAKSNFDYFAGGGFKQETGKNKDQTDALDIAKKNGYKIYNTKQAILDLNSHSGKSIAINPILDEDKALPYAIDRTDKSVSLAQFTQKGIDILNNKKGFFMMVEGGKIDWACHANDATTSIKDTIAFAQSVDVALEFYKKHPKETLILVTADHETGGLTLGFAATGYDTYFNKLSAQKMSFAAFDKKIEQYRINKTPFNEVLADIKNNFGLIAKNDIDANKKPDLVLSGYEYNKLENAYKTSMSGKKKLKGNEKYSLMYGDYEPLSVTVTHILNNKAGIAFTSYAHTALPTPVFAQGLDAQIFSGYYDDTDIFKKLKNITHVK